jgi:putative FmdB family regulatory protein
MPIYEFFCSTCHRRISFLSRSVSAPVQPKCSTCGNANLSRVISTFAYHKSLETIHEESGEPAMFPNPEYYKDPRNIGRWTEKRFQDMGMELPGEVQQQIKAAREGELPGSLKELQSASPDASYH